MPLGIGTPPCGWTLAASEGEAGEQDRHQRTRDHRSEADNSNAVGGPNVLPIGREVSERRVSGVVDDNDRVAGVLTRLVVVTNVCSLALSW